MHSYDTRTLKTYHDRVYSNLADSVMPFWTNFGWDHQHGGFLARLDRKGRPLEADERALQGHSLELGEKILLMQTRMIAGLSWAHSFGLQDRGYLEIAGQTFDFLIKHFWDTTDGGFFYSVSRDGVPLCRRKNTDAHAYAIVGLVAYYIASGRQSSFEYADRVYAVLEAQARDGEFGYIEDFDEESWKVLNADEMNLGEQRNIKTIDMHTNVLEGFTYLAKASNDSSHMEALRRVTSLILEKGLDRDHGCTITAFDYQWEPVSDAQGFMTTSYGINVELAWLLRKALCVLQQPEDVHRQSILQLIDHALQFGFDHASGGLASYGPLGGSVDQANHLRVERNFRQWWVQAELLNALVDAIELTGDEKYVDALLKQWDWVWAYQIDHECGDWFLEIDKKSKRPLSTNKGGGDGAFHIARALIRTSQALTRMMD